MREKALSNASASVLTSMVLPMPGTPSSSTWPPANRPVSTSSMSRWWPTMTVEISWCRRRNDSKEVHANYAAVAEEVIEKEDIPLSHRYHVKRYFQAIRPSE